MDKARAPVTEKHVDYVGAKMGMWLFLFTEMLLFGGLFLLYSLYRTKYAVDFHRSAAGLDIYLGTANTAVLLTSSLTMAVSVSAMKKAEKRLSFLCQAITIALGLVFLVNKYIEWSVHFGHGLYPDSPELLSKSRGEIIFFSLYYVMTGIHGLHVLAGVAVIACVLVLSLRQAITSGDFVKLENAGLYWHFVDIVWIYLFPLFYLIT